MGELRTDGLAALAAPNCQRRLRELSRDQVAEVIVRLHRLQGRLYCSGVADDLLAVLGGLLR